MKNHKGILIDSKTKQVVEVAIHNHEDISKFGVFKHFDAVRADRNNYIYVDDEGAINETNFGFVWDGKPLFGRGVILGVNNLNGETKDCSLSIDDVKSKIDYYFTVDRPNKD